jgi:hypothetical protein
VSTESLLSEYLSKARETQERAEHSDVVKRIEEIFDELKLPWKRDADDWSIGSDVGEVMAGLDCSRSPSRRRRTASSSTRC